MAALYWRRPTAEELAGTGLKPKHYVEPSVDVWPENWDALQLFIRFSTQWRFGMAGPAGLDYGVVLHEMDRTGVAGPEYDDLLAKLRVIEQAALDQMQEK